MSTHGDLIVIRTYENPIPLPTPEVRQSAGIELIDVTVDSNNINANGDSVFPGNINPPVLLDKSSRTTVKTSDSISISPSLPNTIPVVVDKSKSSIGVSKPDSTPSNTPEVSPVFTVSIPRETISSSDFPGEEFSNKYILLYFIACIISSLIFGIDFFYNDNDIDIDEYWICVFANAEVYVFMSLIFWGKIVRSTSRCVVCYLLTTLFLLVSKVFIVDPVSYMGIFIFGTYINVFTCACKYGRNTSSQS